MSLVNGHIPVVMFHEKEDEKSRADPFESVRATSEAIIANWRGAYLRLYAKESVPITTVAEKHMIITGGYSDILLFSNTGDHINIVNKSDIDMKLARAPVKHQPFCAITVQKWGNGYYHFLCENLCKIIRINELNKKIPIICYYNDGYIKKYLELLGVTNPIIPFENYTIYDCKSVIMHTETASGNPSLSDIMIIRKRLGEAQASLNSSAIKFSGSGSAPIVIIKRKELLRQISNFDQMVDQIKQGIVSIPSLASLASTPVVVFEPKSPKEDIELFASASVIIGAHGAGLSNIIFCKSDVKIIELFPENLCNLCYWHLATLLNFNYTAQICKVSGAYHSFEVDTGLLLKILI